MQDEWDVTGGVQRIVDPMLYDQHKSKRGALSCSNTTDTTFVNASASTSTSSHVSITTSILRVTTIPTVQSSPQPTTPGSAEAPPSPLPPPPKDLSIGEVQCFEYDAYYVDKECFLDVNKDDFEKTKAHFQDKVEDEEVGSDFKNVSLVEQDPGDHGFYRGGSDGSVNAFMNVGWIPGCTDFAKMNPRRPLPQQPTYGAIDAISDCYLKCKSSIQPESRPMAHILGPGNHGLGGWVDIGCLRCTSGKLKWIP